ncbi:MAG: hypothetical protein MJZ18_00480 [Bacteroidales bacterium]|nr:hypothetical protein [Bacteroidales bacterium]
MKKSNLYHIKYSLGVLTILLSCLFLGCENEYSTPSNTDALIFSADTLSFDTLLVGDRSETYVLKLYNRSRKNILIDQIILEGGEQSNYSINIDGNEIPALSNVEIASKDSLYIFIDINCPHINEDFCTINDKITLRVGSHTKSAVISTFVQNVNILDNVTISHNTTLNSPLPYRVLGILKINESTTLSIAPGTKLYMGKNASMDVDGTLISNGESENRIKIHGDRLTSFYDNIPAQWGNINIGKTGHAYLKCTDISNARTVLRIDSTATVDIESCSIRDASANLISSRFAKLTIINSVLYNCGESIIEDLCSDICIIHSTISNHFSWDYRTVPSLQLAPYEEKYGPILIANSIIEGNRDDELMCNSETLLVDHCAISKEKSSNVENDSRYINVISTRKVNFADRKKYDYHLAPDSEAIGKGNSKYFLNCPTDFDGVTRDASSPAIGAYESPTLNDK